ncbi:hypothetical protein MHBO_004302, partial [Bonamia ostreae]
NKPNDSKLNLSEFSEFVTENQQLLEILEDAFVFEDFTSEEETRGEYENTISANLNRRNKIDDNSNIENHLRKYIDSNCLKESCNLADIITPDSVKKRRRSVKNLNEKNLNKWRDRNLVLPLDLMHAFEQMHHFHHDAHHNGVMYKSGKNFHFLVKRYFVLHESFLYIFRKEESFVPLKAIWMRGCIIRTVNDQTKSKKRRWGIKISFPSDKV